MKKCTKIVSSTLAGALAVGMVPAMALADDAIELQAELADDVALGNITAAEDEDGNRLNLSGELKFTLSDDAKDPLYVVPTEVTTYTGANFKVTDAANLVRYYKVVEKTDSKATKDYGWLEAGDYVYGEMYSANWLNNNDGWEAGEWYAVVYADADAKAANLGTAIKFAIEAESLAGAYLYEPSNAVDGGVSDTEFAYTGSDLNLDLTFGVAGDLTENTDYKLTFLKKNAAGQYESSDVKDAGSYRAIVAGDDEYAGYKGQIDFQVKALDLSDAEIVVDPAKAYKTVTANETSANITLDDIISIDGVKDAALDTLDDELLLSVDGEYAVKSLTKGEHTFTLSAPKKTVDGVKVDNPNITGTQKITVVRYDEQATFEYDDAEINGAHTITGTAKFDASEISVTDGDATDPQKVPYTVTYMKVGKTAGVYDVKASDITAPGKYKAIVAVNDSTYEFGGKVDIFFEVKATEISSGSVFVTYKNANVTASTTAIGTDIKYTGADVLDDVAVTVLDKDGKALAEGTDYVVEVTKAVGSKDVAVDAVVDAGNYKMTVKPAEGSKYTFAEVVKTIAVAAAPVRTDLFAQVEDGDNNANTAKVLYTGDVIDPIAGFTAKFDLNGDKNKFDSVDDANKNIYNGKDAMAVPEGAYSIVIKSYTDKKNVPATATNMPEAIEAAGTYTFKIVAAKDNVNFSFDTAEYTVVVTDQNVFPDVPGTKWFADEVYKIATYQVDPDGNGNLAPVTVMGGYSNGLFGPYDSMKRGDMALVLARMAGIAKPGNLAADGTLGGALDSTVDVPFADVKGNEYYAWAIKAMSEAGIMGGYTDGSGEFGAQDTLTREQVATVLYRYDGVYGGEASILASAIDGYKDGAEVSKFAVPAMEWAIGEGLFGVDTDYLNPGDDITRAELAAVLVRYLGL